MIDPLDLDTPRFTIEETAHAIGRSYQLIKKWQGAGIPLLKDKDEPGSAGRGRRARYTLRTVITLAIMADMTGWGVPAALAWQSARTFAHVGTQYPSVEDPFDMREPGELFKRGETWLVVQNQNQIAKLVHIPMETFFEWPSNAVSSTLLINCARVIERVIARLEAKA